MELPQTIEWAVHCCWLLAQTDGSPVPRRRLAEFFDLPEPYLAKLLKALVAAEVLASVPGVTGGHRRRPPDHERGRRMGRPGAPLARPPGASRAGAGPPVSLGRQSNRADWSTDGTD